MSKLDLTKQYKSYYTAKPKPEFITIEPASFLSLTGKGDPSSPLFAEKIQAMYATAYTVKFLQKALNRDFVVPKLEALWSFDEKRFGNPSMEEAPVKIPRSEWGYQLLIRMPEHVTNEQVTAAIGSVLEKKHLTHAREIMLTSLHEGRCVQMLHVGPFDREPETLRTMLEFINIHQLKKNGRHHEIYLSDFRRTAPEKLKTILREPVY